MDYYSLVAEHLMGWRRKPHQGTLGGGNTGNGDGETWLYCHWCHQRITPERLGEPCPAYRFPDLTLEALLWRLGELGVHVMLRMDPERLHNRFTVMLHGLRLPDTNAPLETLSTVLGAVLARDPLTPMAKQLERLRDEDWVAELELDWSTVPQQNPTVSWPSQHTHTTAGNTMVSLDPAAHGSVGGMLPIESSSTDAARQWSHVATDLGSLARDEQGTGG